MVGTLVGTFELTIAKCKVFTLNMFVALFDPLFNLAPQSERLTFAEKLCCILTRRAQSKEDTHC